MKKSILLLFTLAWLVQSCGEPGIKTITEVKILPVILDDINMFNSNVVQAALKNEDKHIEESRNLFLKGVDAYRNKNNKDSAQIYFTASIKLHPTPNAYFELGNVAMDKKEFEQAEKSYDVAEALDFKPFSKVLYNKACMYSLQEDSKLAAQYLEYAIQAGYKNIEHLNKDSDLAYLREDSPWSMKEAIKRGLEGAGDAENLFWLQFKGQFASITYPKKLESVIPYDEMEGIEMISYDYENYIAEMRDEAFSREVSKAFYYYCQAYETEDYVALVYVVREEFLGDYAPLLYRMATFTHKGKLIDKKVIAGSEIIDGPMKVATLKADKTIDVQVVNPIFEEPENKYGLYESPLIDTELIGTEKYKVSKTGKIELIQSEDIEVAAIDTKESIID